MDVINGLKNIHKTESIFNDFYCVKGCSLLAMKNHEVTEMENGLKEYKRKLLRRIMMFVIDETSVEIAENMNVSRTHMSNLLSERRNTEAFDIYLFEKIFKS